MSTGGAGFERTWALGPATRRVGDIPSRYAAGDALRDETFNYAWDEAGALTQTGTADLSWDDRGRLSELVWADGDGIAFTYDAQGRRLSKTTFNHQGEGRQTTIFHYLAGSKLLLYEEGPGGFRLDYTYDSEGRRLTITHDGQTYWYIYNGHGDVVGLVDAQGSLAARYEYDDYGRIVHMWGADGSEVREGQGQIHYLNGDVTAGEVSPEDPAATAGATGDGTTAADGGAAVTDGTTAGSTVANTDGAALTGDVTTTSATDSGTSTETTGNGNGNGSGKKSTSATGTSSATTSGKGGGKGAKGQGSTDTQATTGTATTVDVVKLNPYRYAGYRYDSETELYFLESRYYDSWSNRFVSRDSYVGEADSPLTLNRYVYAVNNPENMTDPTGHMAVPTNIPSYQVFLKLDETSRIDVYQAMLIAIGYPFGGYVKPTGFHGEITSGALRDFQASQGITEAFWPGYLGPETYAALVHEF